MKFQVPQFIETETKLIGPFTLKQFLWLASGGALVFLLFATLDTLIFFTVAIPIAATFAAMAFVKINDTPLMNYVLYGIMYFMNPKQYIFKKESESELQDINISKEVIISDENRK